MARRRVTQTDREVQLSLALNGVAAVIQARMGSSRLPGKVLMPLGSGTVLGWVVRAVRAANCVDRVVIATSTAPSDDIVVAVAQDLGVEVVRGSEADVLSRFLLAADNHRAVARFTADCPLLDPSLIRLVVGAWQAMPELDHMSTVSPRSLPRGMDVEVARTDALLLLDRLLPSDSHHRTHVTSYLYTNPAKFKVGGVVVHPAADDLRVTLDTHEDLQVIRGLVERLGDRAPRWQEIVSALRSDRDLRSLNQSVVQKPLEAG